LQNEQWSVWHRACSSAGQAHRDIARTRHRRVLRRGGCALESEIAKGEEGDVPADIDVLDGAADSFRRPIDHGAIVLGSTDTATLTAAASYHAWTFELPADAMVTLRTASMEATTPDTVVYLYRETSGRWGSSIARNDDAPGTVLSLLTRSLTAGRYRVLVKGYDRSVTGRFDLVTSCSGAGCPRPVMPAPACLFGSTFSDILAGSVRIASEGAITAIDDTVPPFLRDQIVLAVRESSYTDVATAEQALAVVDDRRIRYLRLWEETSGRAFALLEYGVGGNSYGAIFADTSSTRVAAIHDGDLVSCTVAPAICRLGTTYDELKANPAFEMVSSQIITAATTGLTSAQRSQILAAVRTTYPEVRDFAAALAIVDEQLVNRLELVERATRSRVVAIEFGAGDNSYGAVFSGGTTRIVARIEDGDLAGCTLLGAP